MADIGEMLDKLVDDSQKLIKDQIIALITDSKKDSEALIKKMGELTEQILEQRANNEITNSEFEELMEDILDLDDMQYNKLSLEAKVTADKIRNGLKDLVIGKLTALI